MKITLRFLLAALLVLTLVGLGSSALAAPGGNADAAHLCQDGGYATLQGSDGTTFSNAGDCVSYAAHGGTIVGVSACTVTSTTGCVTLDNVTLQSGAENGDTITVTGSISFNTACPYTPPANGICYLPAFPNDWATGAGTYVVADASGTVLSHGTFRIADTAGSIEGLNVAQYLDAPDSPSTCALATQARLVDVVATMIDGATGATQYVEIVVGTGIDYAPSLDTQSVQVLTLNDPVNPWFFGQSADYMIKC